MVTITRQDLHQAVSDLNLAFVSRRAKAELGAWAYRANTFTLGGWDKCPLDQVGLVEQFEQRSNYSGEENIRFANEASEVDARILQYVNAPYYLGSQVENLIVKVV